MHFGLPDACGYDGATELARSALDPDARVARALASLYNPYLYPVTETRIQISQQELGYLSGVSRQRVNQALQVLEKSGMLRVEYGGISVLDLAGLKRIGS